MRRSGRIVETGSEIVLLDITGVPVVDTAVARHLLETVSAARLLGADVLIVGLSSRTAMTWFSSAGSISPTSRPGPRWPGAWPSLALIGSASWSCSTAAFDTTPNADRALLQWLGASSSSSGDVLIATVQDELYDHDALQLQEDPGRLLERGAARKWCSISTVVETVDSFLARLIGSIAATSRLLGRDRGCRAAAGGGDARRTRPDPVRGSRTHALNANKALALLSRLRRDSRLG